MTKRFTIVGALIGALVTASVVAITPPAASPGGDLGINPAGFHLTSHPWSPLAVPRERYLDVLEGLCRFSLRQQNSDGAIIDPYLHREVQYSTPYYAYAVATLVAAGRAKDLLPSGIAAMNHATAQFAQGKAGIADQHGEFFIASLTESLRQYQPLVSAAQYATWRGRMRLPVAEIIRGGLNNWQTYAMKGEWLRAQDGLIPKPDAVAFIERAWHEHQASRIATSPYGLYHDRSSNPDTLSVEAVGRGNLLALDEAGYDGPSAAEIARAAEAGTRASLLLQDPTGQVPTNGRTDDHVWVDVGYQLAFEVMAEKRYDAGDLKMAGVYRHAALLAFTNIARWRRNDPGWEGSYFITKNHFDPTLRVGYQDASQYGNYTGSLMFHLAEAYNLRTHEIREQPAPSEIGGYALQLDQEYSSAFANAGGLQVQANLRGQIAESSGNYWTPLGIVRISRAGWDSRLGPADGALTANSGLTFAPAFRENGRWLRMAELSKRYQATFAASFVHPALVRCSIEYHPRQGQSGPVFRNDLVITPDGIFSTIEETSSGAEPWGVTWPLLANDGRPLAVHVSGKIGETGYPGESDHESFLALDDGSALDPSSTPVRSTYGDLQPVLQTSSGGAARTFIYPHTAGQPGADEVLKSFRVTADGFRSTLGKVTAQTYVGRTAAGGEGTEISLKADAKPDVTFSAPCRFLLQLRNGQVIAAEADRSVHANVQGRKVDLAPYFPVALP